MTDIEFDKKQAHEVADQASAYPLLEEFMKDLDNPDEAEKNAEALQKNTWLRKTMVHFAKLHLDKEILATYTIKDDTQAKELIAYTELQSEYPYTSIPPTLEERMEQANEILQKHKDLDEYEKTTKDKYWDPEQKVLVTEASENTISMNIDNITCNALDSWLKAILTTHNILDQLTIKKKLDQIRRIQEALWRPTQENTLEQKLMRQLSAKQESIGRGFSLEKDKQTPIADELGKYFTKNPEVFNNPENYENFQIKKLYCGLIEDALPNRTERDSFCNREDLTWDNGVTRTNNDIHITNEWIQTDNMKIQNGKVVNTVTQKSLDINETTIKNAQQNRERRVKNHDIIQKTGKEVLDNLLATKNISLQQFEWMEREEKRSLRTEAEVTTIVQLLKDHNKFHVLREMTQQRWMPIETNSDAFNEVLCALDPKFDLQKFDCNQQNTNLTAVHENGNNVIKITQWRNSVTISSWWTITTDIKEQLTEQQLAIEQGTTDALSPESVFWNKSPAELLQDTSITSPWLRRALHACEHPQIAENGTEILDRSWLSLTTQELKNLSATLAHESLKNKRLTVDLSNNNLFTIPQTLVENKNIQHLDLSKNRLSYLPEKANNTLQSLTLNNNNARTFYNIDQYTWLKAVHLNNNKLTTLPTNLASDIQTLEAAWNQIQDIEGIKSLDELTTLCVWDNNLTKLPDCIGNMKWLKEIDVSHNKLTTFPEPQSSNQRLEHLSLHGNQQLSEFPLTQTYPQLKSCSLHDTKIKSTPTNINQIAPKIENISIYRNTLSGEQARKQFLDGSLSQAGYNLTNWTATKLKQLFETSKTIKWSKWTWENQNSILADLNKELWEPQNQITISKKNYDGTWSVYCLAEA